MIGHLEQAHATARSQYDKLSERFGNIDAIRRKLQSLRDLGDMVDQDDVVRAASHLVGKGLTPAGLAGLLADMPAGGQGLASWVQNLWGVLLQREQQMMPMMQQARFALGTHALQLLSGQHVQQRVQELGGQGTQGAPNALALQQEAAPMAPQGPAPGGEEGSAGDTGEQTGA